jgi:phosphohistidine phosphatase
MLELIIMRHAHAGMAISDFTRPLTQAGKTEATEVGKLFLKNNLLPDYVVLSPALRTEKTYQLMAQNWPNLVIERNKNIYNGSIHSLMEALSNCPDDAERVILLAHNPGVSFLAEELSSAPAYLAFKPASWCFMQLNIDKWKDIHPACGEIIENA